MSLTKIVYDNGGFNVVKETWWKHGREAYMVGAWQEGIHGGGMAGRHTWWEHGREAYMVGAWQEGIHGGGMAGRHTWWEHGRRAYMVGAWQEGMHAGDTGTGAGGMHPTGMYSCYHVVSG